MKKAADLLFVTLLATLMLLPVVGQVYTLSGQPRLVADGSPPTCPPQGCQNTIVVIGPQL